MATIRNIWVVTLVVVGFTTPSNLFAVYDTNFASVPVKQAPKIVKQTGTLPCYPTEPGKCPKGMHSATYTEGGFAGGSVGANIMATSGSLNFSTATVTHQICVPNKVKPNYDLEKMDTCPVKSKPIPKKSR